MIARVAGPAWPAGPAGRGGAWRGSALPGRAVLAAAPRRPPQPVRAGLLRALQPPRRHPEPGRRAPRQGDMGECRPVSASMSDAHWTSLRGLEDVL